MDIKQLIAMLDESGAEIAVIKLGDEGPPNIVIAVAKGLTAPVLARAADAISDGADPVPQRGTND